MTSVDWNAALKIYAFHPQKFDSPPPAITAKWSAIVLDEGYVPFPKRLLRCVSDIFGDVADLQAVLAVVDYRRFNPIRPPSYDFLAWTAGMEKRAFKARIEDLAKRGLVNVSGIDDAITIDIDPLLTKIQAITDDEDHVCQGGAAPF